MTTQRETIFQTMIRNGRRTKEQCVNQIKRNLEVSNRQLEQSIQKNDTTGILIHSAEISNMAQSLKSII